MSTGRSDLQTRAEYLRKVDNDQDPHASITGDGERVRVYGDVAVVNHRFTRGQALAGTRGSRARPRARRLTVE